MENTYVKSHAVRMYIRCLHAYASELYYLYCIVHVCHSYLGRQYSEIYNQPGLRIILAQLSLCKSLYCTWVLDWSIALEYWIGILDWIIALVYWTGVLHLSIGLENCTWVLDWSIELEYWTGLLDWRIALEYWTRVLDLSIGLEYWTDYIVIGWKEQYNTFTKYIFMLD